MAKYLSREAVFQVIHGIARGIADRDIEALKAKDMKAFYMAKGAKKILDSVDTDLCYIPAADVQPVKHGYWIKQPEKFQIHEDVINSNYLYSCSCCNASDLHSERANNDGEVKFCWRCGAKMDAEPDEPWQSE